MFGHLAISQSHRCFALVNPKVLLHFNECPYTDNETFETTEHILRECTGWTQDCGILEKVSRVCHTTRNTRGHTSPVHIHTEFTCTGNPRTQPTPHLLRMNQRQTTKTSRYTGPTTAATLTTQNRRLLLARLCNRCQSF